MEAEKKRGRGRPFSDPEERKDRYCKVRFNERDWKTYKDMQEYSGINGSELIRKALRYYDKNVIKSS